MRHVQISEFVAEEVKVWIWGSVLVINCQVGNIYGLGEVGGNIGFSVLA